MTTDTKMTNLLPAKPVWLELKVYYLQMYLNSCYLLSVSLIFIHSRIANKWVYCTEYNSSLLTFPILYFQIIINSVTVYCYHLWMNNIKSTWSKFHTYYFTYYFRMTTQKKIEKILIAQKQNRKTPKIFLQINDNIKKK